MTRVLTVIQARMSSTRLPGKALAPIMGEPMLVRQLERVQHARRIGKLVVATSVDPSDDPIVEVCDAHGVEVVRGSLADVLNRYHDAAKTYDAEHIVRLTADCPLADWDVIDVVIGLHLEGGFDYTSNTLRPTQPDGLDVEVVRGATLEVAWNEAEAPSEREHVTSFVRKRPDRFSLGSYESDVDHSGLRWTVDEPEDLEFVRAVYEALYPIEPAFTTEDVLALLSERPELQLINAGIERNEGLRSSMLREADASGTERKVGPI